MKNFNKSEFERKMQLISFMQYLGYFTVKLSKEDREKYSNLFNIKKSYLIYGDSEELKKVGCYFLCAMGRPTYRMVNFSKAVDTIFKGDYEEAEAIRDNSLELFILYVSQGASNISNEQYVTQILDSRHQKGLPTLVLNESGHTLPTMSTLSYVKTIDLRGSLKDLSANERYNQTRESLEAKKAQKTENKPNNPYSAQNGMKN